MKLNEIETEFLQVALQNKLLNPVSVLVVKHFLEGKSVTDISNIFYSSNGNIKNRLETAHKIGQRFLHNQKLKKMEAEAKENLSHLSFFGFCERIINRLKAEKIEKTDDLLCLSCNDLLGIDGLGKSGVKEIKLKLSKKGCKLADVDNKFFTPMNIKYPHKIHPRSHWAVINLQVSCSPANKDLHISRTSGNPNLALYFDQQTGDLVEVGFDKSDKES